jgi:type II secretory pathway pseudopilin PulG
MMFLTILLITLTTALPDIYTAPQRDREEELIFRGNQYARAIALFHQQFNRYSASVDELLKRTNGFRFLRHAYPDPMTRSGKWRFIHANAAGVVLDSSTWTPPTQPKNPPTAESLQPALPGSNLNFPPGSEDQSGTESSKPAATLPTAETSPSGELKGAFVVGVASTSPRRSIRIWNGYDRYAKWEFLGLPQTATGGAAPQPTIPGATAAPGPAAPSAPSTPAPNPSPLPM